MTKKKLKATPELDGGMFHGTENQIVLRPLLDLYRDFFVPGGYDEIFLMQLEIKMLTKFAQRDPGLIEATRRLLDKLAAGSPN